MESRGLICHPTQVNAPRFNLSQTDLLTRWDERLNWPSCLFQAYTEMVHLSTNTHAPILLVAIRPKVELRTFRSQVQRPSRYATKPANCFSTFCCVSPSRIKCRGNFTLILQSIQRRSRKWQQPKRREDTAAETEDLTGQLPSTTIRTIVSRQLKLETFYLQQS